MSTIKVCDVCGNGLELGEEVPGLRLPDSWIALLGIEVQDSTADVCSTGCLHDAATIIENKLAEVGQGEEKDDPGVEEPDLIPTANTSLDPDLTPRFFGTGAGVSERSGL